MSVEVDWEKLTAGAEGARLSESIRNFIHDRFQQVPLPRFIRSVKVLSFNLGDEPPQIEVKDVCDPLPDFYEDADGAGSSASENDPEAEEEISAAGLPRPLSNQELQQHNDAQNSEDHSQNRGLRRSAASLATNTTNRPHHLPGLAHATGAPLSPALFTPQQSSAIPGGTSNLTYFHLPYGAGLSGPTTPLATMAGAHFQGGWLDGVAANYARHRTSHQHSASISSVTPPSSADPASRPSSQHRQTALSEEDVHSHLDFDTLSGGQDAAPDRSPTDLQVVAHVKYCGNLSLVITAEIFLDYPMPSFVAIPLQLHITGFTFDGVAIIAHIKRRVHCCFLSPDDANTFLGAEGNVDKGDGGGDTEAYMRPLGGLLEEVRVESEIGHKETGRQVLKNVGKVEKFVLEQVRRIFEDEFVFPSFWTFLV